MCRDRWNVVSKLQLRICTAQHKLVSYFFNVMFPFSKTEYFLKILVKVTNKSQNCHFQCSINPHKMAATIELTTSQTFCVQGSCSANLYRLILELFTI